MSHHQSHIDDRVISMIIMDKTIHLHMSGSVCHARCPLLDLHLFRLFTALDSLKSLQFLFCRIAIQKKIRQSTGSQLAVMMKSSDSHMAVIRCSSGSHHKVLRHSIRQSYGTLWARIAQNVKKPSRTLNVIEFECFGFNMPIWVPWSPIGPKKL